MDAKPPDPPPRPPGDPQRPRREARPGPPAEPEARRAFSHTIRVVEADLDDLGHVNNVVYLRYIETAAREHAARYGWRVEEFRRAGALPLVRRHLVRYRRPSRLGEVLRVSTRVVRLAGVRGERRSEVRGLDDELRVESEMEWVWCHPESGRPVRVPESVKALFGWSS